jgi:hypothetical protein
VRDGQHLAVAAQLLHEAADGLGHGAADTCIDLVEDQRLRRSQLAGGDRDGQRDARQLAARGDLADRRGVAPAWPATRKLMSSSPEAEGSAGCSATSKRPPCIPRVPASPA